MTLQESRLATAGETSKASSGAALRLRAAAGLVIFVAVLALLPYGLGAYSIFVVTQVLVYAAAAVSLQMLWGRAGQLGSLPRGRGIPY